MQPSKVEIDYTVYPDLDPKQLPHEFSSLEVQADYIARICGAWDFGIVPTEATFKLFSDWQEAFDRYPLLTSAAYHAFRSWFRWPTLEGICYLPIRYEQLVQLEGRGPDPCLDMI